MSVALYSCQTGWTHSWISLYFKGGYFFFFFLFRLFILVRAQIQDLVFVSIQPVVIQNPVLYGIYKRKDDHQ